VLVDAWNEVQAHHMWLSLALRISPVLSVFFSIYIIAKALVTGAFWHFSADLLYPVCIASLSCFLWLFWVLNFAQFDSFKSEDACGSFRVALLDGFSFAVVIMTPKLRGIWVYRRFDTEHGM
jgi:hypothetical protein